MADTPRRFWQIHLSTAIVLVFAAGLILWANAIPRESMLKGEPLYWRNYGWPIECYVQEFEYSYDTSRGFIATQYRELGTRIYWFGVVSNIILTILSMTALVIILEFIFRRREARR